MPPRTSTHTRANSASTIFSTPQSTRESSIVSNFTKSSPVSPVTSFMSKDPDEIVEISKKAFDTSTSKKRKRFSSAPKVKIVDGSTSGGRDPLHDLLKVSRIEPIYWREEREREAAEEKRRSKSKRLWMRSAKAMESTLPSQYLKPERYETLPYSPREILTSGLNLNWDPIGSKQFWTSVLKGWEKGCQRESVQERRARFGRMK